jgi:hypothetical protein
MTYDYLKAVKDDVREYIENEIDLKDFTRDELEEKLNDDLWNNDSVTGNASGSYTFNSYEAGENLNGNWDLLADALDEFGDTSSNVFRQGPEYADVTIRCYLLSKAIREVLDDMDEKDFKEE